MKRIPSLVAAALFASVAVAAQAQETARDFANRAAVAGMFAIETTTLALHRSQTPPVRSFAERVANGYATSGSALRQIVAPRSDIALPDRPDERHLAMLRELTARSDADFDRAYIETVHSTHREVTALLATYAERGDDNALKAYAAKTLPAFQALEREAGELAGSAPKQ